MTRFETLIANAMKDPNGAVYFTQILIANPGTPKEFYIDRRTWENPDGLKVVLPVCYCGGHDWYVCPDCGQLHPAYGYGKRETGCCSDIDCKRLQRIGKKYIVIQRDPIMLLDAEGNA